MKTLNKVISLILVFALSLSVLCSCFSTPDDSGEPSNPSDNVGNTEKPDDSTTKPDDSGNNQTPDGGDNTENGGNNQTPDDSEVEEYPEIVEKPVNPDADAGKNGIEEILLAFADSKIAEAEAEDSYINSTVKFYTFNTLETENNPVALYVIGHGEERVGTDSDVSIIRSLLKEYVVVVLDYNGAEKAVSPYLEESATNHKIDIMEDGAYLGGISYNANQTYLIPAGCRIVRNVEFFNIMKHAPKGVVNKILDVWNGQSQIKTKLGDAWVEAETLDDIVMANGESLTAKDESGNYKYLTYHMDIIYPANPDESVPVIMAASSGANRNVSLSSKSDRYQFAGFLFGGYALSSFDHDYFPFMKDEAGWGHIEPNYSLQTYMGTRFMTAAVRCVKYYSEDLGCSNVNFGIYGHSKSSWVALFKQADLATTDPDNLSEVYTYGGFEKGECFGNQPYQTYKNGTRIENGVTCVYHSMGNGTNECRYLDESNIPQMVGVGEKCEYNSWEKFFITKDVLVKMDASGCNWVPLIMYSVNHTYPPNKSDKLYGYNYYDAFMAFFAYHLKGESAYILHTSVQINGEISEDDGIYVQFTAALNAASALKLVDANGNLVAGEWISARGGTQWIFVPEEGAMSYNNSYKIIVASTIVDDNGNTVEGIEQTFVYIEGKKAPEIIYNSSISGSIVEDTYVASNSTSAQSLDYSTSKDVLGTYSEYYRAYFKFNFSGIISSNDFEAFKDSGKIQFSFAIAKGADSLVDTTKFTFGGFTAGEGTTDVAFSEVTWKNIKSGGIHDTLNWGSATNVLSSESEAVSPENISYYGGVLTFTFDYSEIADMIDTDTGYAVFVLRTVGTSGISIASMENKTYAKPSVSFVYNK